MSLKKYFLLPMMFVVACAHTAHKNTPAPSSENKTSKDLAANSTANRARAAGNSDLPDAILGTWVQTSVECSQGELTAEGKLLAAAFRSGMSTAKVVVTSDRTFWDLKEYKDLENPNNFCQVSVEERWATPSENVLVVSDSDTVASGNGQVECNKDYKRSAVRTHQYKIHANQMDVTLSSAHEANTGATTKSQQLCKEGLIVLKFQRDQELE